jgi:hypothetical protein
MEFRPRLKIYKSSSGKNTFNPETFEAHSYGHWKYVCKIKGKVVFNDYRYSVTTSKHQSEMRSLLVQLGVDKVVYVNQSQSLSSGIIIDSYLHTLAQAEIELENIKGKSKDYINKRKETIATTKATIKQLKALGGTASVDLDYLKGNKRDAEKRRLERNRAASLEQRNKVKALKSEFGSQMNDLNEVAV